MLAKKWLTPLAQLIAFSGATHARHKLRRFENQLHHCRLVQDDLLRNILRLNQSSDFGRQHRFDHISDYQDFTSAVPPARYDYFKPYIDRCCMGETGALFGPSQKLIMFALTSGTTAAVKLIPVTQTTIQRYRNGWNIWGIKALSDHPHAYLRKILQVSSPAEEYRTEAGIPCGAISGMLSRHQKYIVRQFYATPACLAEIPDSTARYYTIMRVALTQDIGFISTANPSTTVTLARTAERYAPQLIRDLHDGTIDKSISLAPEIRDQITPRLKPSPQRARQLQNILDENNALLPSDYWDIAFLANWTGGTLSMYLPQLKKYFGDAPLRDIGLLASEGRMSIPLVDNTSAGVLDINANFYEFVPAAEIDRHAPDDTTSTLPAGLTVLRAEELQKGELYYIFLTNFSGLYRYHIGDLVGVTDHIGTTPVIEFLSKGAHTSSITGEKLTENQVVQAVQAAAAQLNLSLGTFIMAPHWGPVPYYLVSFESDRSFTAAELKQIAHNIDAQLCQNNIEYESKRKSSRLGHVQIRQLPHDTITQQDQKLRAARQGRSEQFKHRFLYNQPFELDRP